MFTGIVGFARKIYMFRREQNLCCVKERPTRIDISSFCTLSIARLDMFSCMCTEKLFTTLLDSVAS